MANIIPASVPTPEQGDLLTGQGMDSATIKLLFEACNWAQAYNGTGTPRISQTFPRRGTTTPTGLVVYTSPFDRQIASWLIPDTRGATQVACYAYGSSVGGGGKIGFRSHIENDFTGMQNLPATPGLVGPYYIDIDTSGGYEEIELLLGAGGGDVTLDSILVVVEPLSSPIAAGADSLGVVAFDEGEHDPDEPLASDAGRRLISNLTALRTIPHVYYQWSGVSEISNLTADRMVGVSHTIPLIVWPDTENEEDWELTVWVNARNTVLVDTEVVINVGVGSNPNTFDRQARITIPAGSAAQWRETTLKLPNHHKLIRQSGMSSLESVSITIWPVPVSAHGIEDYIGEWGGAESQLSTAEILGISIWGV